MNICRPAIAAVVLVTACAGFKGKSKKGPATGDQTPPLPPLEPANCKDGYCEISKGPFAGKKIAFKQTPVTNTEWTDVARGLGEDRYVLLRHDIYSGKTRIERVGKTAEELLPEDLRAETEGIRFNRGSLMIRGSLVLLKMVDNPSAVYDNGEGRIFSGALQPVVGVTYLHAVTWTILKSQENGGRYRYDLPTDDQHEYVASNAGTCTYGTEACSSIFKGDRKLVYMDEWNGGRGATVAVNDPRYNQKRPFGVDTTGNVWRWIRFNPAEALGYPAEAWVYGGLPSLAYGLRGGSWRSHPDCGQASVRYVYQETYVFDDYSPNDYSPAYRNNNFGFSVIRQDLR